MALGVLMKIEVFKALTNAGVSHKDAALVAEALSDYIDACIAKKLNAFREMNS